ncbi:hypothetical protein EDB86DRAFT_1555060 [Lactarius hatsudake]|nr:hypothetical protein EDB86DRAFT_1555060 [Lactarius hatsudake]
MKRFALSPILYAPAHFPVCLSRYLITLGVFYSTRVKCITYLHMSNDQSRLPCLSSVPCRASFFSLSPIGYPSAHGT